MRIPALSGDGDTACVCDVRQDRPTLYIAAHGLIESLSLLTGAHWPRDGYHAWGHTAIKKRGDTRTQVLLMSSSELSPPPTQPRPSHPATGISLCPSPTFTALHPEHGVLNADGTQQKCYSTLYLLGLQCQLAGSVLATSREMPMFQPCHSWFSRAGVVTSLLGRENKASFQDPFQGLAKALWRSRHPPTDRHAVCWALPDL
jgi:hypothetical protein